MYFSRKQAFFKILLVNCFHIFSPHIFFNFFLNPFKTMRKFRPINICLVFFLLASCVDNDSESLIELPEVITTPEVEYTVNKVLVGGVIMSDGGGDIKKRGVIWSTNEKLSMDDHIQYDQSEKLYYKVFVNGLRANTTYFFTAFAENERGVTFGEVIAVKTPSMLPSPPAFPLN